MESHVSPLVAETTGGHESTSVADLVAVLESHGGADQKRSAAARLFRHVYYTADRMIIVQCGGIDALFRTLETATDYHCQLYALGTLAIIESEGWEPLDKNREPREHLIRDPTPADFSRLFEAIGSNQSDDERIEAVEIVACLSLARPDAPEVVDFVPRLVFLLRSSNAHVSAAAARTVFHLTGKHAERLAQEGAVQLLVELIRSGGMQQKEMAANALAPLLSVHTDIRALAVSAGAINVLVQLLHEDTGEQRVNAALALGSLVHQTDEHQSEVQTAIVEAGAVVPLLKLLRADGTEKKEAALYAIVMLVSGHETNRSVFSIAGIEGVLVQLLQTSTYEKKCHAANIVALFVNGNRPSQSAFAHAGGVAPLLELLRTGSDYEKDAAASAIARLVNKHTANKRLVVEAGAIDLLVNSLLTNTSQSSARSTAVTVLGLLAQDDGWCKLRIYKAGALAPLVSVLREGSDKEKTQATVTLARMAENNEILAIELASLGALELLVERVKVSVARRNEDAVVTSLSALSFLSTPPSNQDVPFGLGIRAVLTDAKHLGPVVQAFVTRVWQSLRSSVGEPAADSCRIM